MDFQGTQKYTPVFGPSRKKMAPSKISYKRWLRVKGGDERREMPKFNRILGERETEKTGCRSPLSTENFGFCCWTTVLQRLASSSLLSSTKWAELAL